MHTTSSASEARGDAQGALGRLRHTPARTWLAAAVGGAAALAALTVAAEASRRLGLVDLHFGRLLGTALLEADDEAGLDRASAVGWTVHAANGPVFGLGYAAGLRLLGWRPTVGGGVALGVPHALASLGALALAPHVHPRPERAGLRPLRPTAYGALTIPGMVAGHLLFGAITAGVQRRLEGNRASG